MPEFTYPCSRCAAGGHDSLPELWACVELTAPADDQTALSLDDIDGGVATEDPPEPEAGTAALFIGEDYEVGSLGATLGAINLKNIRGTSLEGLTVKDRGFDLTIRSARVSSAKVDDDGSVVLVLWGNNLEVTSPPTHRAGEDPEPE